jgi:hypothetical protein
MARFAALFAPKAAKHSMDHFAGLDVSVKDASACIVDDTGRSRGVKAASEPEALQAVLNNPAYRFKQIGLEAGPLSRNGSTDVAGICKPA